MKNIWINMLDLKNGDPKEGHIDKSLFGKELSWKGFIKTTLKPLMDAQTGTYKVYLYSPFGSWPQYSARMVGNNDIQFNQYTLACKFGPKWYSHDFMEELSSFISDTGINLTAYIGAAALSTHFEQLSSKWVPTNIADNYIKKVVPSPYKTQDSYLLKQIFDDKGTLLAQLPVGRNAPNRLEDALEQERIAYYTAGLAVVSGDELAAPAPDSEVWYSKPVPEKTDKPVVYEIKESPQFHSVSVVKKKKTRKKTAKKVIKSDDESANMDVDK